MAAPITGSTSASPLRTSGIPSEKTAPKKAQPGDLPFTRSAVPERPATSTGGANGGERTNIGRNDFPTSLIFTNSEGVQSKIRRASLGQTPAPLPGGAEPAGNGENKPA